MADLQTVIYPPPRRGLPHLVVTISDGAVTADAALSKLEARTMAVKRALRAAHRAGASDRKRDKSATSPPIASE
jgi:hypothetical protein